MADIKLRSASNKDGQKIKELVFSVLSEYGLKPDVDSTDSDLDDIETNYINRNGIFELAEDNEGNVYATMGLFKIDSDACEIRKMYINKNYRGKGIGKFLLLRCIEKAKMLGYKKIILETASALQEAIGLYTKHGFKRYCPEHLSGRCDQAYYLDL